MLQLPAEMIDRLNIVGEAHKNFAAAMLVQTAILFLVIGSLDLLFLRRQRTVVRYAVWSLLLVKLVLPTSLSGPLSFTGMLDSGWIQPDTTLRPESHLAGDRYRQLLAQEDPGSIPANVPSISQNTGTAAPQTSLISPSSLKPGEPAVVPANLPSIHWQTVVLFIWVSVVSVLSLVFLRRLLQVRRLVQSSSPADERLHAIFREAQGALQRADVPVALRVSSRIGSPAICGFWKPTILIPQTLAESLDRDQLRFVMVHELIHWRRRDLQAIACQSLLQIIYFYNPFVWIANSVLRRLREYSVDEETLLVTSGSVSHYANTLVDVMSHSRQQELTPAMTLGVVGSRSTLYWRVRRMLSRNLPANPHLGWKGLLIVALLGALVLPLAGRKHMVDAQVDTPGVEIDLTIPQELLRAVEQALQEPNQPNNRQNNLSDVILMAEEYPELQLAADGTAEDLLTAAGVEDVANDELVGIVLDVHGKPVADAKVDAWSWYPGNETITNKQGLFRLKNMDPRRGTQLVVSKDGYSPRMYLKRAAGRKDWVVILRSDTFFEGTVLGIGGKPVKGATVRATCGPFNMDGGIMTEYSLETVSHDDGTFRLYVMPNRFNIQASAPGRGVQRQSGVAIGLDEAVKLPVQLEPGVRFEARVIDSQTKQPVEGFRLFKWQPPRISGRSDEKGVIVFEDLIPGEIQMQCGGGEKLPLRFDFDVFGHGPFGRWWSADAKHEHERFQIDEPARDWQRNFDGLTFDLSLDMEPVTIVVEQGVTVSGRVTDPEGNPVEGATVAPAKTGSGNSLTGDTRYSVRTDKDGTYRMLLPASNQAEYNLVVHDGDYDEWRRWANGVAEPFQTKPGETIEDYNLQLTVPAVIRGRVTSNGKPVADRQVRTHDFHKQENRYYDPTVRTAADGTFELKFVRPGKHYLQVHPFWLDAENAQQGSTVVEVEAGEVLEDVELQVNPQ